jgi:hypothetical protein
LDYIKCLNSIDERWFIRENRGEANTTVVKDFVQKELPTADLVSEINGNLIYKVMPAF